MLTVAPEAITAEFKMMSVPDVPADASATKVPPDVVKRPQVAVPLALAVALEIALAVNTPPLEAGANGVPQVFADRAVVAVPPVAGRVPL